MQYKQCQITASLEWKLMDLGEVLKPEQVKNLRQKTDYKQLVASLKSAQAAQVENSKEPAPGQVVFNFKEH